MSITFKQVSQQELPAICALYQQVIESMRQRGLKQWEWEVYPTQAQLAEDAARARLYRVEEDGKLCGAFALSGEPESEYAQLSWHYGVKPATLHRLAMLPECFGTELASRVLALGKEEALRLGFDSLRIDVCAEDERMRRLFASVMTREAGRVTFEETAYCCYEAPLSDTCPMLPIRMYPAYRYGDATPWGGDGLREAFHRDIPDERTGEALEISAIPGLESVTATGETLPHLIERDGARLVGDCAGKPFPLLLKLLAAKQPLSVQVHPNDDYAREHERKLGKTEAWVILRADEGASILYGMKEGVTLEQLREGLESGVDIEPLIARVPVRAGEVYYMPSGMVHAIGGGIVLYEIQQSSDVTYRLWDYNRTDAKGNKRPLHIRQSLDVIDPALRGMRAELPTAADNAVTTILDVPAFRLLCADVNGECELPPHATGFRMLTALAGLLLSWQGDALELSAGDSVLLPASCPPITLKGVGKALLSRG